MIYLAALILLAAAVSAVAAPFWRGQRAPVDPQTDDLADDLAVRREKLYEAIRELELEQEAGSISAADYERVRTGYELQAAALLQEEQRRPRPPERSTGAVAAAPSRRPVSHRLGLLVPAAVILIIGVALGFFLSSSLGPREAGMGITGSVPGGPSPLQEANAAFDRGDFRQAIEGYKKVLDRDPHNTEALTQIGVVLGRAGHYDDALLAFDQALRVTPDDPKALFEKGLVLFQGKVQPREGVKVWERLIRTAPPDNVYAANAKRLLDQVRGSMGRPPVNPQK